MFGCCVAGRLLQTDLQQIDDTHASFQLPAASSINHICVFLLGTVPFPDGYGATVHFFWPGKGFQLLGMLSNEKPSAIFRLKGTGFTSGTSTINAFSAFSQQGALQTDVTATLGLSIEPLSEIQLQMQTLPSALTKPGVDMMRDPTVLAERIVKHLFNYVSGFTGGAGMSPDVAVPMSVIAKWYESFMGKIRAGGVGFLERGN
ncbi:uncharacterized protein LACBIDRAFT_293582 [Laccaria bicolor S238N-H82]|uniref:Predicted protein n=1 Tax=Laccaria bicolor (strain S238N-H82 / ATCC MYA-4686) TaxID=486041 RepID=B0D4C1_LACBS|nr:uncharacterized protein LACBIDRAFT_293582 [Laccaria bicolor S238N-H82]EDR10546.1 predicted protein [Laccaria bicolor S238N-H82]|eukprot:XP_001878996.1 predicted protein [Laccaria bicolor S238N-H82]